LRENITLSTVIGSAQQSNLSFLPGKKKAPSYVFLEARLLFRVLNSSYN